MGCFCAVSLKGSNENGASQKEAPLAVDERQDAVGMCHDVREPAMQRGQLEEAPTSPLRHRTLKRALPKIFRFLLKINSDLTIGGGLI